MVHSVAHEPNELVRVLRLGPNKCPRRANEAQAFLHLGCAKNEADARSDLPRKGEAVSTKLGRRVRLNARPRARHLAAS